MSPGSLDFLFHPKSIAVVGASNNIETHGHNHLNFQILGGFKGPLYPIHPKQTEVLGLKAYPSLEAVPGTIDHVLVAVGINNVPDLLTQASKKGVKSMHVYSGRASETGRPEAKELDKEILRRVKEYGIRLVGPNALGLFCPSSGLAMGYDIPTQPGHVGAIMQSGANSTDLCHFALLRGVKFSALASYGNALDINEGDLWQHFIEDEDTRIIVSYIEGLRIDPQKYIELVRKAASKKPVIICKGGRSQAGARFTLGHTASNAEVAREIFGEPLKQAGAILVRNIDELLDMAVAFSFLSPIKGRKIGTGGGGGGNAVLYTDEWEEAGFELTPLPAEIHEEFKRRGSQMWDWIKNPGDFSVVAPGDPFDVPALLAEMAKHPVYDFIVGYVGEDFPFKIESLNNVMLYNAEGYIKVFKESKKPFFAIVRDRPLGIREMEGDRHKVYARIKTRFLEEGVPFFSSVGEAATAMKHFIAYHQRKS